MKHFKFSRFFSQISGSLGTSRILWKLRMVKTKVIDTKNIETGRFHRFCLNKSQNSCQNVDFCLIQVLQNWEIFQILDRNNFDLWVLKNLDISNYIKKYVRYQDESKIENVQRSVVCTVVVVSSRTLLLGHLILS